VPQFVEMQLGYSPLGAGAGLLPLMGVFAVTSFIAGSLYNRLGGRIVVAAGAACLGVGILLLSFLDADTAYAGHDRARRGCRTVLFGHHHDRGHRARPVTVEPGGGIVYMLPDRGWRRWGSGSTPRWSRASRRWPTAIALAFKVDAVLAFAGLVVGPGVHRFARRRQRGTLARCACVTAPTPDRRHSRRRAAADRSARKKLPGWCRSGRIPFVVGSEAPDDHAEEAPMRYALLICDEEKRWRRCPKPRPAPRRPRTWPSARRWARVACSRAASASSR
jgi:hypothetical protein